MFRVFRSDDPQWDEVVSRVSPEQRDVHFTSAYARVQEIEGGEAFLCVVENEWGILAQAFMKHPIPNTAYYDIKNLYGFGGPFGGGPSPHDLHAYVTDWAIRSNVVSEYCALHPLLGEMQLPLVRSGVDQVIFSKDVVVLDFNSFRTMSRRIRRGVKCAEKDYSVVEMPAPLLFDELYRKSMARLSADLRWQRKESYWFAHGCGVKARWFFVVGMTENDPKPRRGLLTIGNGRVAYAHYLGSDGEKRDAGLDELLYVGTARALFDCGYELFHLGGGLTERSDDPLLAFKSGFSPLRYKVGTYRRIFMPPIYAALVEQKALDEIALYGRTSEQPWFPLYRRAFA